MDWNAITLSIIENALWPILLIILLIWFIIFGDFKKLIESIKSLQVGSFSIVTKEAAEKANALAEYQNLSSLTYQQLHLFLVVGGESGDQAEYKSSMNTVEFQNAFKKLNDLGLIEYIIKDGQTHFGNTDKGKVVHKVIMDNLYHQLNA